MNPHPYHTRGILYACITALMWGVLAISLKVMLRDMSPASVVFARFSIAFVLLFIYQAWRNPSSLAIFRKPPILLPLAAIFLSYNYFAFVEGLKYLSPSTSQVFIQVGPVFFAIGGFVLYKEEATRRHLVGFLMLIAGFSLYYYEQVHGKPSGNTSFGKGMAFILTGGLSWAGFALIQKKLLDTHRANDLNLFIYGFCAVLFLPFFDFHSTAHLDAAAWGNLVFLGLNTLIAYNCFALAMHYTDANKISVIVTLNPIITFILMFILGLLQVRWIEKETFTLLNVSGAVIALAGVLLVVTMRRKVPETTDFPG